MHLETHSKQAPIRSARLAVTHGNQLRLESLVAFEFLSAQF